MSGRDLQEGGCEKVAKWFRRAMGSEFCGALKKLAEGYKKRVEGEGKDVGVVMCCE
jgi:hypothetical protein